MKQQHLDILKTLVENKSPYNDGFYFYNFKAIRSGLSGKKYSLNEIRLSCRYLKRKGYAEFMSGLFTEEGDMAGSGYGATDEGEKFLEEQSK